MGKQEHILTYDVSIGSIKNSGSKKIKYRMWKNKKL